MSTKPHYGRIERWRREPIYDAFRHVSLGFVICGAALDHPVFSGEAIRTSYVVAHDTATGEIETRNSRYTLVGPEVVS